MYSTAHNPSYVTRAYEAGASVYFPKPDSYRTLIDSLTYLLRNLNWGDPTAVRGQFVQGDQYRVFSLAS